MSLLVESARYLSIRFRGLEQAINKKQLPVGYLVRVSFALRHTKRLSMSPTVFIAFFLSFFLSFFFLSKLPSFLLPSFLSFLVFVCFLHSFSFLYHFPCFPASFIFSSDLLGSEMIYLNTVMAVNTGTQIFLSPISVKTGSAVRPASSSMATGGKAAKMLI